MGPAADAVGFLDDVAVDVEVARLSDCRHGDVLVGLPQEASSVVQEKLSQTWNKSSNPIIMSINPMSLV